MDGEIRDYSDEVYDQPSDYELADYGKKYGKVAFVFVCPNVGMIEE